jgi:hypothetical protein
VLRRGCCCCTLKEPTQLFHFVFSTSVAVAARENHRGDSPITQATTCRRHWFDPPHIDMTKTDTTLRRRLHASRDGTRRWKGSCWDPLISDQVRLDLPHTGITHTDLTLERRVNASRKGIAASQRTMASCKAQGGHLGPSLASNSTSEKALTNPKQDGGGNQSLLT